MWINRDGAARAAVARLRSIWDRIVQLLREVKSKRLVGLLSIETLWSWPGLF